MNIQAADYNGAHRVEKVHIFSLLTAEDIWFKCDLSLPFIPPINLWKICIDLRPFSKCFRVPFLRRLQRPQKWPQITANVPKINGRYEW